MRDILRHFWLLLLMLVLLSACGETRKSVYPPSVSIQQLKVLANDDWQISLRILNNGYARMHYKHIDLDLSIDNNKVEHINEAIDLRVPPLSADNATLIITPSKKAQKALAGLGNEGSLAYAFSGHIDAIPDRDKKTHSYEAKGEDWLSMIPGLKHTYR